jgi:hypothetical protein
MSKQQTAVEWLEEQISNSSYYQKLIEDIESPLQVQIEGKSKTLKPKSIFQQAKQIECEQIAKAWERRAMDVTGYDYYRLYHGKLPYGGDHE